METVSYITKPQIEHPNRITVRICSLLTRLIDDECSDQEAEQIETMTERRNLNVLRSSSRIRLFTASNPFTLRMYLS